jgi:acyl dehydratase
MMYAAFGEAWSTSGKLKVRFKAPTRPGDTVTASARILKERGGVAEYAVQCASQAGEVLIEGRAALAVTE